MSNKRVWLLPVLLVVALLIIAAMLRLAIWQLDRADEKQSILDRRLSLSLNTPIDLTDLETLDAKQRFLPVFARGRFLVSETLYLDNQVFNQQVGYQVITPFKIQSSDKLILVARGWVAAGSSRDSFPSIETTRDSIEIVGRLNLPAGPPPLWDEKYAVNEGARWQYLDMPAVDVRYREDLHSLVLELHPEYEGDKGLRRAWDQIDDRWVAKHKAYAFQWFSMAAAFFVACLVLIIRRRKIRK